MDDLHWNAKITSKAITKSFGNYSHWNGRVKQSFCNLINCSISANGYYLLIFFLRCRLAGQLRGVTPALGKVNGAFNILLFACFNNPSLNFRPETCASVFIDYE